MGLPGRSATEFVAGYDSRTATGVGTTLGEWLVAPPCQRNSDKGVCQGRARGGGGGRSGRRDLPARVPLVARRSVSIVSRDVSGRWQRPLVKNTPLPDRHLLRLLHPCARRDLQGLLAALGGVDFPGDSTDRP